MQFILHPKPGRRKKSFKLYKAATGKTMQRQQKAVHFQETRKLISFNSFSPQHIIITNKKMQGISKSEA